MMPPTAAATDPALPHLSRALEPALVARAIEQAGVFAGARVAVADAHLVRHKLHKRALIAYDIEVTRQDGRTDRIEALGKMRARHRPHTAERLLRRLWHAGFDATSTDGISVPEPLGVVAGLDLWLQRRVPGATATVLLTSPECARFADRIARAAHKIHQAGVRPRRVHRIADELRMLDRAFVHVTEWSPQWRFRLARLLESCRAVAGGVSGTCGVHRDFYGDQILINGERLWLVDFDLYCDGPQALDTGNFIGHLIEQGIREPQHRATLDAAVARIENETVRLAGESIRAAVRICAALTVARHVYLSTVVPGRLQTVALVLDVAERLIDAERGATRQAAVAAGGGW